MIAQAQGQNRTNLQVSKTYHNGISSKYENSGVPKGKTAYVLDTNQNSKLTIQNHTRLYIEKHVFVLCSQKQTNAKPRICFARTGPNSDQLSIPKDDHSAKEFKKYINTKIASVGDYFHGKEAN